ncbi:site-specific integrase [Tardiphaga sp.]|uniref:site-specific integrase n=1 Tax=Tardiphaga sp. TaxID=1926292 RepID=UPI002600D9CE|nr:site-specific integrase [Tardiphaga sp.]
MQALAVVDITTSLPAVHQADIERALDYALADKAESTRKAYRSDFAAFEAWCRSRQISHMPATAAAVASYLAWEAAQGAKASTIGRRCAAIRYFHKLACETTPTDAESVKATMRGIRRIIGAKPVKKAPATGDLTMAMVAAIEGESLRALRNRALLLFGFASACRRSEIVAFDVADLQESEEGYRVTIGRSKTDQEGAGHSIAIPRGARACPVKAVRAWLEAAGITEGPVFRPVDKAGRVAAARLSDRSVANIVKEAAEGAGLDPASFAGHSLRAGFLTSAAKRGANIFKMMEQSRHKSVETLRGYVRDAELFQDHAGAGLL